MYYIKNLFTRKIPFLQSFSSSSKLPNKHILNKFTKTCILGQNTYTRNEFENVEN